MRVVHLHTENNDFQRFETLKRNREKRARYQEFLIEGVLPIKQALRHNWPLRAFIFSSKKGLSDWATGVVKNSSAEIHYDLEPSLLEKLSEKEETSELIAVAKIPADDPERINLSTSELLVVLDRPQSPGNLGSSIRSCDALGVSGIFITGHAADPYHPQAVRGSMGSLFAVPIVRLASHESVIEALGTHRARYQIVATAPEATQEIAHYSFNRPTILVMGNETFGLSRAYRESCDTAVTIPMQGAADSLNISCALSIVLYEIQRQRKEF